MKTIFERQGIRSFFANRTIHETTIMVVHLGLSLTENSGDGTLSEENSRVLSHAAREFAKGLNEGEHKEEINEFMEFADYLSKGPCKVILED